MRAGDALEAERCSFTEKKIYKFILYENTFKSTSPSIATLPRSDGRPFSDLLPLLANLLEDEVQHLLVASPKVRFFVKFLSYVRTNCVFLPDVHSREYGGAAPPHPARHQANLDVAAVSGKIKRNSLIFISFFSAKSTHGIYLVIVRYRTSGPPESPGQLPMPPFCITFSFLARSGCMLQMCLYVPRFLRT